MVLSVVRGEVSLATPALHPSLARRAAVGRPQHGEWDSSDIPTEAQLQMQRHAAKRLEQQQRELIREEAEAAAAEAKRDRISEAVEAEMEAAGGEAARAETQASKNARMWMYRRGCKRATVGHSRSTIGKRTGAAVPMPLKSSQAGRRLRVAEAEEADVQLSRLPRPNAR